MLQMPESWDPEQQSRCGTNTRERSMLKSTNLKGVGDLRRVLTQDLMFALMIFLFALLQYFFNVPPFVSFAIKMYILSYYWFEVCDPFV